MNIILTRQVAGVIGEQMSEEQPSSLWPAMRFHPTLPPVTVQNEAEEQALPEGYRAKVWSAEEIAAQAAPPARPAPRHEDEASSSEPHASSSDDPQPPRSRR